MVYSNIAPIDFPVWMRRIASPSNGAMDISLILSGTLSPLTDMVSVTTTSLAGQSSNFCKADTENNGWVAQE